MPQALLVTSPDYPCLAMYVDATGRLGDTQVYISPVQWGTVSVFRREVVPIATYEIAAECGSELSAATAVGLRIDYGQNRAGD